MVADDEDENSPHLILFTGTAVKLGNIHKKFVKSENLMKNSVKLRLNFIPWWIESQETNLDELERRSKILYQELVSLKSSIKYFYKTFEPSSYPEIIGRLKDLIDSKVTIIDDLNDFLNFLYAKNVLAPFLLYTHEFWRSDKNDIVSRNKKEIPENDENFEHYLIEFAVGLKDGDGILTFVQEKLQAEDKYANSIDPEYFTGYPPRLNQRIFNNTHFRISERFDLFFSNIRNSLDKIIQTIDLYQNGPIYYFKQLAPNYQGLDEKLIRKFRDLEFLMQDFDTNAQNWLKIIKLIFGELESYYNYRQIFRDPAQLWIDEPSDMNPFFGSRLKSLFGDENADNSRVSDGNADHFVYGLPIEDKLIRSTDNLRNEELISMKFKKHHKQFQRIGNHKFCTILLADIRDEIKEGKVAAYPIEDCFDIIFEEKIWFAVFLFQAFQDSPSKA